MIDSQQDLSDKINLVRWEEEAPRKYFDLTTIHSLTIDSNPKFKELKEIVKNYNSQQKPERIRYQQKYIEHLFKMLSQLTRIPLYESQLQYLEKIHKWAFNGQGKTQVKGEGYTKTRPGTATTRTRPGTALTRPTTGFSRPATGKLTTLKNRPHAENFIMKKDDPRIDYSKLKPGQQEFYAGVRTLHCQYEDPKKRLKQYQRNVFYQDQQDSDVQIIDLDEKEKPKPLKELKMSEEQLIQELKEGEQQQEEADGAEGAQGAEGAEANVDDIPLQGEQEGGQAEIQEQKQIIDKLKPRLKAYGCPQGQKISKKSYEDGMREFRQQRLYNERKVIEDKQFILLQSKWAQGKAKSNSQMRRRAQSARIVTKKMGIGFKKTEETPFLTENIVNFQNVTPVEVNAKGSRPSTAFRADNPKNREQLIQNAFLTGKLLGHVQKGAEIIKNQGNNNVVSFTVVGQKPKKKNFQDILREAEERVAAEAANEIEEVKQTLAKAKVSIGANRIAKSISYYDKQLPDVWVGGVAGMCMIKNPFIKVTKKKKKKKKK